MQRLVATAIAAVGFPSCQFIPGCVPESSMKFLLKASAMLNIWCGFGRHAQGVLQGLFSRLGQ